MKIALTAAVMMALAVPAMAQTGAMSQAVGQVGAQGVGTMTDATKQQAADKAEADAAKAKAKADAAKPAVPDVKGVIPVAPPK
jgi:hypothetical protein